MDSSESKINDKALKLLQELYDETLNKESKLKALAELRILTREKVLNDQVLNSKLIELLINYSSQSLTEAQKCLSNLILNYEHIRDQLVDPYVKLVEARLTEDKQTQLSENTRGFNEVLYYDSKIIFLLSALCPSRRSEISQKLTIPILESTIEEINNLSRDNYLVVVESLKTLFNLTLSECSNISLAGDLIKKLFAIVVTSQEEMLFKPISESNQSEISDLSVLETSDKLLVNLIHLLTNMPKEVHLLLSEEDANKVLSYCDQLLKNSPYQSFRETILPVLNVCANICKYNEQVRQKWFDDILGSVEDFEKRPEEYDTLRGRLVKLMTSVDVHIKDIAAEFLYSLCKGDTDQFITFTGFGNSAAFLSSRGLLSKHHLSKTASEHGSNDEYKRLMDSVNPVTGRVEKIKKDPMQGMTEEEKEYHAHELANAIAKLTNLGVMRPMRVDETGQTHDIGPSDGPAKKD